MFQKAPLSIHFTRGNCPPVEAMNGLSAARIREKED